MQLYIFNCIYFDGDTDPPNSPLIEFEQPAIPLDFKLNYQNQVNYLEKILKNQCILICHTTI